MRAAGLHTRGDEERRVRFCKLAAIAALLSCLLPEVNNAARQVCHVGIAVPKMKYTHCAVDTMPTRIQAWNSHILGVKLSWTDAACIARV